MSYTEYQRQSPTYRTVRWDGTNQDEVISFMAWATNWNAYGYYPLAPTLGDDGSLTVQNTYFYQVIPANGYAAWGPFWADPVADGATLETGGPDTFDRKFGNPGATGDVPSWTYYGPPPTE